MTPERRYRLILLSYPRPYRAERAEEMLDVLLAAEGDRMRSWMPEAVSLIGHGLALRLRQARVGWEGAPSLGLAGASLVFLLAVLGVHHLGTAGLRGVGLDGYPDHWRMSVVWVDPRWPVQAWWVLAGLGLLLGRHALAVTAAWGAGILHLWYFLVVVATGADLWWPGYVGSHWSIAGSASTEPGWLALSVCAAVMLGGRNRAADAGAELSRGRWRAVAVAGAVGAGLAAVAGPLLLATQGTGALPLSEDLRGPVVPLLLAAAVLAPGLLRARHGRVALAVLAAMAPMPLAARWWDPVAVLGVGAALAICCAVAAAPRPSGTSPPRRA